jgi:Na+/H+-dicarboxylate symporter
MKERSSNSSNSPLHDRLHTAHSPQRPFWDLRGWSASGQMVVSVIIGAGVGTLVSTNAANGRADLAFWLGFPGGLFLRALKALVIPLIFCSIVCSTVEMSTLGLAGTVGSSTFLCYMATTALAVLTGIVSCTAFKSLYSGHDEAIELLETNVAFVCGGGGFATGDDGSDGSGITHVMTAVGDDRHGSSSSRSVQCLPLSTEDEPFFGSDDADEIIDRLSRNATFGFLDVNGVVQRTTSSIVAEQESIPETIAGALESIVTDNFTAATAEPDILAIICFAIFFGSAVAKIDALLLGRKNLVLVLLSQLNEVVTAMLALVLSLTPLAVASLIAGAIATVDDYSKLLGDVGTLMASYFTTFAVQGRRLF